MRIPKVRLRKALQSIRKTTRLLKSTLEAPQRVRSVVSTVKARRVARRKSSGLHLVPADRFDLLNTADWASLTRDSAFLSPEYLRVLEAHGPANLTTRYAMAYQETEEGAMRPLSAMLFQRLTLSADRLRRPRAC